MWALGAYGLGAVAYLALNGVAGRLLGPAQFGTFVVLVTLSTTVGQVGLLGVHRGGLRDAARTIDRFDPVLVRLRGEARAVACIALPTTAAVTAVLGWLVMRSDQGALNAAVVATEVALLVHLGGQQKLCASYLRGLGRVRAASLLDGGAGGVFIVGLQSVLVAVVLATRPQHSFEVALAAMVVGYAVPVAAAQLMLNRAWAQGPHQAPVLATLGAAARRHWRFGASQIATFAGPNIEIWVAGAVLVAADSSRFAAAQRVALILLLPLAPIQLALSPHISRLASAGHRDQLQRALRTGASLALALSVLAFLPLLLAPGSIIGAIFGAGFAGSETFVLVLCAGSLANVATGLCGPALSMTDHSGAVAAWMWAAVALRVAVGLPVAITFGALGLVITSAFITAVVWLALVVEAHRRVGVLTLPTWRPRLGHLRAAGR